MKKSVSAPSGLLAPDESRKGLKKVPSVSVLREESEPEEDEERGGVKVGKNLSAVSNGGQVWSYCNKAHPRTFAFRRQLPLKVDARRWAHIHDRARVVFDS